MKCFRQQREMKGNNVAGGQECVEVDVLNSVLGGPISRGKGIVSQHRGFEATKDLGGSLTDTAGANDANRLAAKIEADQSVEREIEFPDSIVSAMNFAVQGEQQTDRVLRNG